VIIGSLSWAFAQVRHYVNDLPCATIVAKGLAPPTIKICEGEGLAGANRVLAIDVGAGTQDILLYESNKPIENCVKMILPSQTSLVAGRIKRATAEGQDVFLTGNLMGGGPCVSAMKRHIRAGFSVYATPLAAKTIRDNPREVEEIGVHIVEEVPTEAVSIETRDVHLDSLRQALGLFDVELPECYAIAVQDHGETLEGSQRRFRFQHWERFVEAGGHISSLAYREIPDYFTRMRAVRADVPGALLMDTGSAAIWGALCDPAVAAHQEEGLVIVNVGNQHTVGVLLRGERVWGLFEHHTVLLTAEKLAACVGALRRGTLSNDEVYDEHGHGAMIHADYPPDGSFEFVAVTGPNRHMAEDLGYYMAVPYGDMMLSGAFGLVAAGRRLGLVA
jgi:uncharacterized protein (DUF1786 family)